MTIEERVSLLELQVESLDEEVDFLFDETVIQDERLFSLEQETEEIEDDIVSEFLNVVHRPLPPPITYHQKNCWIDIRIFLFFRIFDVLIPISNGIIYAVVSNLKFMEIYGNFVY